MTSWAIRVICTLLCICLTSMKSMRWSVLHLLYKMWEIDRQTDRHVQSKMHLLNTCMRRTHPYNTGIVYVLCLSIAYTSILLSCMSVHRAKRYHVLQCICRSEFYMKSIQQIFSFYIKRTAAHEFIEWRTVSFHSVCLGYCYHWCSTWNLV